MNMERFGGFADNKMGLENLIQIQLAQYGGEELVSFIDEHGEQVRKILDSNTNLVNEFEENPEFTIEKLAKIVYH